MNFVISVKILNDAAFYKNLIKIYRVIHLQYGYFRLGRGRRGWLDRKKRGILQFSFLENGLYRISTEYREKKSLTPRGGGGVFLQKL